MVVFSFHIFHFRVWVMTSKSKMAAPSKKRAVEDEMKNKENTASDDDEWEDIDEG